MRIFKSKIKPILIYTEENRFYNQGPASVPTPLLSEEDYLDSLDYPKGYFYSEPSLVPELPTSADLGQTRITNPNGYVLFDPQDFQSPAALPPVAKPATDETEEFKPTLCTLVEAEETESPASPATPVDSHVPAVISILSNDTVRINLPGGAYILREKKPIYSDGAIGDLYEASYKKDEKTDPEGFLVKLIRPELLNKKIKEFIFLFKKQGPQKGEKARLQVENDAKVALGGEVTIFQLVHGADSAILFEDGMGMRKLPGDNMDHPDFEEFMEHLTQQELVKLTHEFVVTLLTLAKKGICHFDLKPGNILFDSESRRFMVVDFGCSQLLPSGMEYVRIESGTPAYRAVETAGLACGGYKSDISAMAKIIQEKILTTERMKNLNFSPAVKENIHAFLNCMQGLDMKGEVVGKDTQGKLADDYMETVYRYFRPGAAEVEKFFDTLSQLDVELDKQEKEVTTQSAIKAQVSEMTKLSDLCRSNSALVSSNKIEPRENIARSISFPKA